MYSSESWKVFVFPWEIDWEKKVIRREMNELKKHNHLTTNLREMKQMYLVMINIPLITLESKLHVYLLGRKS